MRARKWAAQLLVYLRAEIDIHPLHCSYSNGSEWEEDLPWQQWHQARFQPR